MREGGGRERERARYEYSGAWNTAARGTRLSFYQYQQRATRHRGEPGPGIYMGGDGA